MSGEGGNQLQTIINVSGVPDKLRGKALRWLLRLVGGTLGAEVVEEARKHLDTTAGRSRVNLLLAEEVARQAIADPETMERAKARFLCDEFRKQENREAVAQAAAETLAAEPEIGEDSPSAEVDEDWLNVFSRYAEDASSERMQDLWGRVLAGEIRKPGAYSPAALRFVAELDQSTAEAFKALRPHTLGDFVVRGKDWGSGANIELALQMEAAGLVTGASDLLQKSFKGAGDRKQIVALVDNWGLVGTAPEGVSVEVSALLLTKIGKELLPLMGPTDPRPNLRLLAEQLKDGGFTAMWMGPLVPGPQGPMVAHSELLWETPEVAA